MHRSCELAAFGNCRMALTTMFIRQLNVQHRNAIRSGLRKLSSRTEVDSLDLAGQFLLGRRLLQIIRLPVGRSAVATVLGHAIVGVLGNLCSLDRCCAW